MLSHLVIGVMRVLAFLPLAWLRCLGAVLGHVLYRVVPKRRHVTQVNLRLCFPHLGEQQIDAMARLVLVHFAQAWLDRSWLWHSPAWLARSRCRIVGDTELITGQQPVVIFSPHFVGLDAGWTALTQQLPATYATIYTNQANQVMDRWILAGRKRFGACHLYGRIDGVKPVLAALKAGERLYLLPDMNFGPQESVFVPFYNVPAATVPSLSRFARLTGAQVVPVVTRMTRTGYDVEILPAWLDFPTSDSTADTATMNRRLQRYIDAMPAQYYWVHKRFKDRPPGETAVYADGADGAAENKKSS